MITRIDSSFTVDLVSLGSFKSRLDFIYTAINSDHSGHIKLFLMFRSSVRDNLWRRFIKIARTST